MKPMRLTEKNIRKIVFGSSVTVTKTSTGRFDVSGTVFHEELKRLLDNFHVYQSGLGGLRISEKYWPPPYFFVIVIVNVLKKLIFIWNVVMIVITEFIGIKYDISMWIMKMSKIDFIIGSVLAGYAVAIVYVIILFEAQR